MTFRKTKFVDVEASCPISDVHGVEGYGNVRALVRVGGTPVGFVNVGVSGDSVPAAHLIRAIAEELSWPILVEYTRIALASGPMPAKGIPVESLAQIAAPQNTGHYPLVTVAVCTRNRAEDLSICLASLLQLDYPNLDLVVVDNAPADDSTRKLVEMKFPTVRYVCEPRPGLDWARNRAVLVGRGEIIAYTDDDVVVDPGWVRAIVERFNDAPDVMGVTGLVVAYEMETEAQELFELYGGFGRGFRRGWFRKPKHPRRGDNIQEDAGEKPATEAERAIDRKFSHATRSPYYGTGIFGTGCNMAFRRNFLESIGGFDPALDVGTQTNGGGDLEMFFRVLRENYTLAYEPSAIVRHRHRREREKLFTQIRSNGVGLFSYFLRIIQKYPTERSRLVKFATWWLWYWDLRRLLISFFRPGFFPRDMILAEFKSAFTAPRALRQSRVRAAEIEREFPGEPVMRPNGTSPIPDVISRRPFSQAVRVVELTEPLQPLNDIAEYPATLVIVSVAGLALDRFELVNSYQTCGVLRLREEIVKHCCLKLLQPHFERSTAPLTYKLAVSEILRQMEGGSTPDKAFEEPSLPANVSVSVVVATYDRPQDLAQCLERLRAQESRRSIEIVVVDNHPASGVTAPVVEKFPGVKLVNEERTGLAYARNAGFAAATGDILLTTDDDVIAPPNWVERTVTPFARNDVMVVCGNVIPVELESPSQQLFEVYGGLGKGYSRFEVDGAWFRKFSRLAVPVWQLGATANCALRADVLRDPRIGMFEESLGPGMPSGVGEDIYFFYKVLKANMTIMYEPASHVYHRHRREIVSLRKQLYGYSKGFVCYNLTTLFRDGDFRALHAVFVHFPRYVAGRIWRWARKRGNYPLGLILREFTGWFAAPWALWASIRRAEKLGRSPAMPPAVRLGAEADPSTQSGVRLSTREKALV